jgi:hypothetical protein
MERIYLCVTGYNWVIIGSARDHVISNVLSSGVCTALNGVDTASATVVSWKLMMYAVQLDIRLTGAESHRASD